jgi:hypothetical protein
MPLKVAVQFHGPIKQKIVPWLIYSQRLGIAEYLSKKTCFQDF